MQDKLVSIIIPTYNRAHLIGETLDSIVAQTYTNWECIVVDDGSTDNTDEVLAAYCKKDSRFQYQHRSKDRLKGANACRNYGFEISKGEYLIFLDSDDLLEENCIELRCEKEMNNDKNELSIFNMGLLINNEKTNKIFNKDFDTNKDYLKHFFLGIVPWTISCVFWRKEVFKKIGEFDESYQRLQDVDLHTRLLLNGYKIKRIKITDSWYRILADTKDYTSNKKLPNIVKAHILYINKYYNFTDEIKGAIKKDEINELLNELYFKVLKKYVFKDILISYSEMKNLDKQKNILNTKERFWLHILAYYYKLNLNKKKGVGYLKVRNKAFNFR